MDRRYRLKRARWRLWLVSISLLLAPAGLLMIVLAWPSYRAGISPVAASGFIQVGAWLGLAGIALSAVALCLCRRWHRHSIACGGAMAGLFAGAAVFGVSLILLAGTPPPATPTGAANPPPFETSRSASPPPERRSSPEQP